MDDWHPCLDKVLKHPGDQKDGRFCIVRELVELGDKLLFAKQALREKEALQQELETKLADARLAATAAKDHVIALQTTFDNRLTIGVVS